MSFFTKKINDHLLVNEPAGQEQGFWVAILKNPASGEMPLPLDVVWNPPPAVSPEPEVPAGSEPANPDTGEGDPAPPSAESTPTEVAASTEDNPTPEPGPPAAADPGTLATLVYVDAPLDLGQEAEAFTQAIEGILEALSLDRAMIWLTDPAVIDKDHAIILGLDLKGGQITSDLLAPPDHFLPFQVASGASFSLDGNEFSIRTDQGGAIRFLDLAATAVEQPASAGIAMLGEARAAFRFDCFMHSSVWNNQLPAGFQFHFPLDGGRMATGWFPLFPDNPATEIGMHATIHPLDFFNAAKPVPADPFSVSAAYRSRRTHLTFSGKNKGGAPTVLPSFYRTIFGEVVSLVPLPAADAEVQGGLTARLVFTRGNHPGPDALYLAPEGDFVLQTSTGNDTPEELVCGLQGTEFIEIRGRSGAYAGDRLRFLTQQAAFAPGFPFQDVSPLGPPLDARAPLLTNEYTTAWAMVLPGEKTEKIEYVPQSQEAALYGNDGFISDALQRLFGHVSPAYTLSRSDQLLFPLLPYAGVIPQVSSGEGFTKERIEAFESQVLSPARRDRIGEAAEASASSQRLQRGRSGRATNFNVTNPDGVIINIDTSGGGAKWKKITIGRTRSGDEFAFLNPVDNLQQAFSTADLFLVVANPLNLQDAPRGASYDGQVTIEDWTLKASVGDNRYADYSNIILFKTSKGPLYDPDPRNSLVANPNKWTQRADFSAPTTVEAPDVADTNQLVVLAGWLQNYFAEAAKQAGNPYFEKFNALATDPFWEGLLVLRMNIDRLPNGLAGIRAGVRDESAFYAHHFGIEINQIRKDAAMDVQIDGESAMFGLIYYEDPAFVKPAGDEPVQPIIPDTSADYDFRLLTLKVLFENTAIKDFESYAQVTLNSLFDMRPSRMGLSGNPYNTIVLRGSYHNVNGKPVFGLGSVADYAFYFDHNLFNKIELSGAQLITRSVDDKAVACWFALRGYLDFRIMQRVSDKVPVDLIGFGSGQNLAPGEDGQPRQGLHFSNLGLEMRFAKDKPREKSFGFNIREIRFDLARSTPREGSLYNDFALQLKGLTAGNKEVDPGGQGYLPVSTDMGTSGVSGSAWFGFRFRLNMGSPGELAGKVSLDSELIFAWSPNSKGDRSYKAMVGIQLPGTGGGAKLIDLQNVLKLSIGQVRLLYADQGTQKGFLLMLTDIALKFLGLLKIPPSGATNFYLFGNPDARGEASGLGWYALYRQSVPE